MAQVSGNDRAEVLATALEAATTLLLEENRSPARRLGQIDNRGSHAWLALYWARELAAQETSPALAAVFDPDRPAARGLQRHDPGRAAGRPGFPGGHRRLLCCI